MNQPRVAHIGWLASSHLERRATELARRGVPTVVFTDQIPAHLLDTRLPFTVELLPHALRKQPLQLVAWLEERLGAHNVDLLHIHSTHLPAALGFFVRTVPKLTSIWDFVHARDSVSPLFHKVILDELQQGKLSEALSFSSRVLQEEWIGNGLATNLGFWHSWGVNLHHFSQNRDEKSIAALRQQLGIKPEQKIIFSPRTPSLPANLDLLLQALPRLEKADQITCLITGHAIPAEARYLERLIRRRDIADMVQFIETIHDQKTMSLYYQLADVVVSLHSNDHNPATVLEAMAMGGLVLINESPFVEHWIKDGRNGLVAQTRNLDHLVAKLDQALHLPQTTLASWRKFNRAKIETEANFHQTMDQVQKDYQQIRHLPALPPLSSFHQGLLADICGNLKEAAAHYRQAQGEDGQSRYLVLLIEEKNDLMAQDKGISSFHVHRADRRILQLKNEPRDAWEAHLASLPYPQSLFRHDVIAGFYPFLRRKRFHDIHRIIDLLAERYHTDTLEWLAESIQWFGLRWSLWKECAALILSITDGGTSLACHALQIARELGEDNPAYQPLLERARDWSTQPVAVLGKELDKKFRQEIHQESLDLLARLEKAA